MMQTVLTTYVLVTFIAVGISLDCEECIGHGTICHGAKKACSAGEDTCAIIVTRTHVSMNSMKRCMESKACTRDQFHFNTVAKLITATNIFCCVGEECDYPPEWHLHNYSFNGKECPACFSMQTECKEEIIPCTGDENYCFQMSGSPAVESIAGEIHVKGCANKAACNSDDVITDIVFPGIKLKQKIVCNHGSASIHLELFVTSLTILTCLLLL